MASEQQWYLDGHASCQNGHSFGYCYQAKQIKTSFSLFDSQ